MLDAKTDFRPLSLLVGSAFFMEQLDSTIIAPAVPQMAKALGVGPLSLDLSMTVYLLCSVIFIPLSGLLAGRMGTRSTLRLSLLVFVLSSAACGIASNLAVLIAARAVQGFSGALMVPVGRIAIVRTTPREMLVPALAWMITPAMLGPLLGPPLGGVIATFASWRWIFFLNIPIGLAGCMLAERIVPQIIDDEKPSFDWREWTFLSLALAALVALLELAHHTDVRWQLSAALATLLGVSTGLYLFFARRSATPLLDFSLLRFETFHTSFWAGSIVRIGYGAVPFLLPLMLQIGLGYSAIESGGVLLASGAIALVTKTQTTGLLRRFGFRNLLILNGILCSTALVLCAAFRSDWGILLIALAVSAGGFSRSVQFNALAAIAYADLPTQKVSAATTLNTAAQQLAVLLGISLAVVIVGLSAHLGLRAKPDALDFSHAFVVVGLIAMASVPFCFRLSAHAGLKMSGHIARNG
ncbi:major Facilitator Superfamily protein [Paraburkholderia xenovorans LB400]|uniref:Major facilitator superfamily (MFS) multidrug efflux pump n=1 Tax=Paraburkholderia xenovorans (strain LB400) TaxID=266265 RepID=Q13GI2_PARXL|nr:MFS transporter [Paraburkholderia xenovorans]ABE36807.1 major facilitator superfamily (MFS) multidrug efflux pump [Paraburkholderia xenovorans LB400]AIP34811.1 major Facilitator Superfamily protein [Paraburkholderia xenovorans LB400]